MTILHDQGDDITGGRIIAYARRIELMRISIPRTQQAQGSGSQTQRRCVQAGVVERVFEGYQCLFESLDGFLAEVILKELKKPSC